MPGPATPALRVLRSSGVPHVVHEYELDEARARAEGRHAYGPETAAALGVAPDLVFKTLVAAVDGRLVMAVVPVSGELDLKRLAEAVGGRFGAMADPAAAERATGYVVGGISPWVDVAGCRPSSTHRHSHRPRSSSRPAGAASRWSWTHPRWSV